MMRRCRACPGPHPKPSLRATTRREAPWRHRPYFPYQVSTNRWPRGGPSTRRDTFFALVVVGDLVELVAQSRRTAPRGPSGRGGARPCHGEQRLVQTATDHRLSAESVAAAQDHRDQRHTQPGAGDHHGVVGDDAHRAAFDSRQRGDHLGCELLTKERHRSLIGQRLDDRGDLVGPAGHAREPLCASVFGHMRRPVSPGPSAATLGEEHGWAAASGC